MLKPNDARVASKFTKALALSGSVVAIAIAAGGLFAGSALAQDAAPETAPAAAPADDSTLVIVTGFRGSLQTAISEKKRSTDMIDVIKSEDIGQFPDLNLAESLQRIPGVSIDRDGGEGKQITVRGLNSEFSRTRLNGLEALATTGSKDSSGGTNRGRGFDFNVFAADLFNSLTVRKSLSAEIEEGSLGATVDLQTARPFDYKGFTMAGSLQAGYNDASKQTEPRGTFMVSNRWADGRLGALLSVAYSTRTVIEDSTNTTRWENAYANGNAGRIGAYSTDGGATFTPVTPCTNNSANQCNTNEGNAKNPVLTDPEALAISHALHPRIPRYNHFETDQERLGITAAFQMRPNPDTLFTLEGMYATFGSNREEWEIEGISFSRTGAGFPKSSVYDYTIDDEGTMTKASFNDVDIRAEHRYDELKTTFQQLNLTWDQNWGDRLTSKVLIGASDSLQDNPEQTTFTFESYNVDGYSYDYSDMTHPSYNYGTSATNCSPDQACYWTYSSSTANGDASLIRLRPQTVENSFATAKLDLKYKLTDNIDIKAGVSSKKYEFTSTEYGRYTTDPLKRDENASGAIVSAIDSDIAGYSETVTVGGNTYLIPNLDKIRSTFDYNCNCTNAYGTFTVNNTNSSSIAGNRNAQEVDTGYYLQADFRGQLAAMPFRGNIGTREVRTETSVSGYIGTSGAPALTTIRRSYSDSLPALNVMIEPIENVYLRFAAAKTMARPTLLSMTPGGGSIDTTKKTLKTGNPYLDPVRANTLDFSVEWYPDKDTMVTLGVFQKDIKSYIQSRVTSVKLSDLGYNYADLGESSDVEYDVTTPVNTPGGDLKGFEINIQKPFTFLPGFLSRTGGILNYTHVESQIQYYIGAGDTTTTAANLLGLSPEAWNATLYYEGDKLSGRVAASYRDGYLSQLAPGSSADFWGKHETLNIDAQLTYKINKQLTLVLEGINLTNEADDRYIAYDTAQGNTAQNLLYDYGTSGRQYYLGLRYKY
ncbi:TonB-dependent receptor [Asticcacaulis sp.]|uniref:TonB-dependent receptor n=1 Tax=Asticcacaulis sp. TaxID=1872648 RepID=UPI002C7B036E|nr:TonB-dependent receptor [Asticcacaulis sp.]HTM82310.1 TonB-dependent receptor [Asticcacaulis sp.]